MNALWPLKAGASTNSPKRIILHAMGEWIKVTEDEAKQQWAKDKNIKAGTYFAPMWLDMLGLSAHALVSPSGVVIKCRTESQGAYHAKGFNTDTLGVEFLVPGVHGYESFLKAIKEKYLTVEAYGSGIKLVRQWMITYRIDKKTNIVTHHQIDPTRKEDPGEGFPLYKFIEEL